MNHKGPVSVTPVQRLQRIVDSGMCIGCGLCQSVAGSDKIKVQKSDTGMLVPIVVGKLSHKLVDIIYDICPGTHIDGLPVELTDDKTQNDLIWGPYRKMQLAWASDNETRFKAATGGVLTALGQYLLASKQVDFILHVRASGAEPSFGEPCVSIHIDEVINGAGSRYGPTPALVNLNDILDRGRPFCYVGLPCDVSALRNYAYHDKRVDKLVRYWLTPVCGGFMQTDALHGVLEKFGIDPGQVSKLRYRGNGCPGPTAITLENGRNINKRYTDFWGGDESAWNLPHRCKVCADGIGEAADIAASDTWPGGTPDPAVEDQDPGINAVIVRTAKGQALLNDAVDSGYITLGETVDPRYMDKVQPHQRNKKLKLKARWNGQASVGGIMPSSSGLRLDELYKANDDDDNRAQFEGAKKRMQRRLAETLPD